MEIHIIYIFGSNSINEASTVVKKNITKRFRQQNFTLKKTQKKKKKKKDRLNEQRGVNEIQP